MSYRRLAIGALAAALAAASARAARAQGTLSTQGFGYPPGQISTRAATMGGGLAEVDPFSAVNPATLGGWLRSGVYVQYAPEFRTVTANGQSDHTTTIRFPLMQGALTAGSRATIGLSLSTLLDRTWATTRSGYDHFGSDSAPFTEVFKTAGAINDVRIGMSFAVFSSLWLGVAGDVYTGSDVLTISRTSTDTTFASFSSGSRLSYSGGGAGGGIVWQPVTGLTFGASGRVGGRLQSYRNDTSLTRAKVPKRLGAGVSYSAIPGLTLAVHAQWDGWTSLAGLGSPTLGITDAWTYGGGAEVRGPSLFGAPLALRLGYSHRTLPFQVNDQDVRENTISAGLGFALSQGRSRVDLGLLRASRGTIDGVSEHAWTFSAGIMVRP